MNSYKLLLGVNIDHVATLRQARGIRYPDPVQAVILAEEAGADGITLHLREDRRHIQDADVWRIRETLQTRMNLEMAATDEMVAFALQVKPEHVCLVPEKREELTTEGGLNILDQEPRIAAVVDKLSTAGIEVSLFIDPAKAQLDAARRVAAPVVELHTGSYAEADTVVEATQELERIRLALAYGLEQGLVVNAGHGLNYQNVEAIAALPGFHELNIGHSIVARALFVGFKEAVAEMKRLMRESAC